jgi:hypothetical protein
VALAGGVAEDWLGRLVGEVKDTDGVRRWRVEAHESRVGNLEEMLFGRRRSYQTGGVVLSTKNTNPPITHLSTGICHKKL